MKMSCLIVDDEPPALKVLESHINNISYLEIAGKCQNAIEAIDVLRQKDVDVIFVDIKMPKLLGTDFIRNLSHPPKIIFVTAYREYAVEGFELDAVDYLVKPVSFERFVKAIIRLRRTMGQQITYETQEYKSNPEAFVYLKVDKDMQRILVNDILYLESWKDYTKLYLSTGKYLLVKHSISSLETLLSEHKFLRVHRSYLVSLPKITGYNGVHVKLKGEEIPIGRLYKQHVMGRLTEM